MKNLRKARTAKGYTQSDMGALIGLSRQAYAAYETGFRDPDTATLTKIAEILGVTTDYLLGRSYALKEKDRFIPILGSVPAGLPIEAIEDIEDFIPYSKPVKYGEVFALRVVGNSMEPDIRAGDIVIVQKQEFIESGDIAIVRVNGQDEVTVKKVKKLPNGLMLIPANQSYEPMFYDNKAIEDLPVSIVGKVVEMRRTF